MGFFPKKRQINSHFCRFHICRQLFYFVAMEVTDQLIDHLAKLSKLSFNETEKEELKTDLQKMISFVDKLQELDTTGVEPLTHMGYSDNALRDDVVKGMVSKEEALLNTPVKDEQFFKVPKVINPQ